MATKPSLSFPQYIGIGAFLTVLAAFVSVSVVDAIGIESRQLALLVLLVLFSAGQTTVTYLMINDRFGAADESEGDATGATASSDTAAGN